MGVGSELGGVVGVLVVGGVRRRNAPKQKERGMSEVTGNKYIDEFKRQLDRYTDIEKILRQHNVKCSDWIGLVEKLHALTRPVPHD